MTFGIFFYFSLKIGSHTSCKLSPKETICMKCQILFSRKNNKNSSEGYVLPAANLQSQWTVKYKSRSNIDTAVWVVIPKCKIIPSIITVAFIVLGKWPWISGSKLGLTQTLTDWWTNERKTWSLYCTMLKAGPTKISFCHLLKLPIAC